MSDEGKLISAFMMGALDVDHCTSTVVLTPKFKTQALQAEQLLREHHKITSSLVALDFGTQHMELYQNHQDENGYPENDSSHKYATDTLKLHEDISKLIKAVSDEIF